MIILSNFMKSLLDKRNEYQSDVLYNCVWEGFSVPQVSRIESSRVRRRQQKLIFADVIVLHRPDSQRNPDFPHIAKNNGTAHEQDLWACGSVDTPPRRNHSI